MLTEDGKHLYVSYDEYHNLIEKLALKVHQSGWEFDTILCLARGGMRPGDILSRIFDVPLAIMSTSSYRAEAGKVQGHLDIAHYITTPQGQIAGTVLLVDDLAGWLYIGGRFEGPVCGQPRRNLARVSLGSPCAADPGWRPSSGRSARKYRRARSRRVCPWRSGRRCNSSPGHAPGG